jgi:hypothetical protein
LYNDQGFAAISVHGPVELEAAVSPGEQSVPVLAEIEIPLHSWLPKEYRMEFELPFNLRYQPAAIVDSSTAAVANHPFTAINLFPPVVSFECADDKRRRALGVWPMGMQSVVNVPVAKISPAEAHLVEWGTLLAAVGGALLLLFNILKSSYLSNQYIRRIRKKLN